MRPVGAGDEQDFFFTMSQEQAQDPRNADLVQKGFSIDDLLELGSVY